MATTEHNSATALPQQSLTQINELNAIHDRFTFLACGLQGVGTAASCTEELGEVTLQNLGHAAFALGQYAQDLNTRLERVIMHNDRNGPQKVV